MRFDSSTDGLPLFVPVTPSLFPEYPEQSVQCPKCKFWRLSSAFTPGKKSCSTCKRWSTSNYRKHRVKRNIADVARMYDLTPDQLIAMREACEGKCAICGQEETHSKKNGHVMPLAVDHDHKTGKVRGLLCYRCNTMLGFLEKSTAGIVDKAWEYLSKHTQ